ncbi:hypothetical protein NL676_014290 [Syzygium grande]|nr:hypothetical protein NL676_014290 [Syzygium grande]
MSHPQHPHRHRCTLSPPSNAATAVAELSTTSHAAAIVELWLIAALAVGCHLLTDRDGDRWCVSSGATSGVAAAAVHGLGLVTRSGDAHGASRGKDTSVGLLWTAWNSTENLQRIDQEHHGAVLACKGLAKEALGWTPWLEVQPQWQQQLSEAGVAVAAAGDRWARAAMASATVFSSHSRSYVDSSSDDHRGTAAVVIVVVVARWIGDNEE